MQTHKPGCASLSCRPIQFKGRLGLSISVALYFPFRDGEPFGLWSEASMWAFLGREMSMPLIDEGVIKTSAEYLVHAVAHPPRKPAAHCAVRARVGSIEKTLVVHGDRVWRGDVASDAEPFDEMPLGWQRAYGGTGFPANPEGIGRATQDAPQRLPNTEYPKAPTTRPDRDYAPAGFGRLDPMWALRAAHRGTYDENWLAEHAPGFAPDVDWRHFNLAPTDQWFPRPLEGNERFEFDNLHPTQPRVSGRLPGLACRCFLRYRSGPAAGKLRSVPLTLGTLWFFPHAERGVMIYQGLADIAEDDAADVDLAMIAVERMGEPRLDEHYAQVMALREDPTVGALYALRESDLTPAGLDLHDPDMAAIESDFKLEGFLGDAQYRGAEAKVEQARERVRALGLNPDALGVRMPAREPLPSTSELPAYVQKLIEQGVVQNQRAMAQAAQDIVKANETARAHGIDPQALKTRGPPAFRAAGELRSLVGIAVEQPDPRPMAAALLAVLPKLVQAEAALRMAYRVSAHLQAPADALSAGPAAALREQVLTALRAGKGLAFADLTGADLSGLDLSGVDLRGAQMESVDLSGSRLVGADLSHAVLAHGCLEGADFSRAKLVGANLGTRRLAGAQFDAADLSAAILSTAHLERVSFREATLAGVQLFDTTFGAGCDWRGAHAGGVTFIKRTLSGLVADGADLGCANFIECALEGASFRGAQLAGANFVECSARDVSWLNARLAGVVFAQRCNLAGSTFDAADLSGANLRGARMAAASLRTTRLDGADLSEADLADADLSGASLKGALLVRTELPRARAAKSNWMHAIAQKADLRGVDLSDSNLHGADMSQAIVDAGTLLQRALVDRLKIHPRRRPPAGAPQRPR